MNNRSILNFLSHLLYNQFSWSYDIVASVVSLGLWEKWVMSVLPFIPIGKILEIGFGPGHLQTTLNKEGNRDVFGIDLSSSMCRLASRNIKRWNYIPKIVRGISTHLPFPNTYFDTIVSTFPTSYILEEASFYEINRILKSNGTIVILPFAWFKRNHLFQSIVSQIMYNTGQFDFWINYFKTTFYFHRLDLSFKFIDLDKSRILIVIGNKL